jgi:signal transduction histidine kinase
MTAPAVRRTVRTVTSDRRAAPGLGPPAFQLDDRVRVVGAAVIAAVVQVGVTLIAGRHQPEARSLDLLGVGLLLIGPAGLLVRRRHPPLALLLAFVPTMAYGLLDFPRGPVFISLLVAFVNAVLRGHRTVAWASLAAGYLISGWLTPLVVDDGPWPDWAAAIALGAWLLVLLSGTELARSWLERAAERSQARAEEARRRASEERLRIARELHDVLAHNISLINVRAGVALHLVDERPDHVDADQVRPALAAIKDASKEALGELRSVLDVLRQGEEAAPREPTAGLRDLDALAQRARGTGLEVRIETPATLPVSGTTAGGGGGAERDDGDRPDPWAGLPAGIDLAAFRVAQEALTNVVRHADATRVTVRVRRTDDELEVQVDDDGHGADTAPGRGGGRGAPVEGRGIAGMRERAQALGGTLEAGPRPGRGFRVRARLPLRGDA